MTPTATRACGSPDGAQVDVAGNVWTIAPDGVWVISLQGKLLGKTLPGNGFEPTNNLGFADPIYGTCIVDQARLWKLRVKVAGYHPF